MYDKPIKIDMTLLTPSGYKLNEPLTNLVI